MYKNSTSIQSNTTAIAASAVSTLPDYSNHVPYFVNFISDRDTMSSYYGWINSSLNTIYRSYLQFGTSHTLCQQSRSNFGPWKDARKWPMYIKKKRLSGRIQTYQKSEFGGNPIDKQPRCYHGLYRVQLDMQPIALRRIRPYYEPSYATYPPSIMNAERTKKYSKRYSIMMRITVKMTELLLGVVTIGFILVPMCEMSFYAFIKMIQTQWQGFVLSISASFSALCFIMLFGICFGYRYLLSQKFNCLISLLGSFGYLFAGIIEAHYAFCYLSKDEKIGLVCYRLEWIIASGLIFINIIVYIVDCLLSFRTGN